MGSGDRGLGDRGRPLSLPSITLQGRGPEMGGRHPVLQRRSVWNSYEFPTAMTLVSMDLGGRRILPGSADNAWKKGHLVSGELLPLVPQCPLGSAFLPVRTSSEPWTVTAPGVLLESFLGLGSGGRGS